MKIRLVTITLTMAGALFVAGCERRLTGTRLDMLGLPLPISIFNGSHVEQLEDAHKEFLQKCDQESGETVPHHPLSFEHLYVYDATTIPTGEWGFSMFDNYAEWIRIYKTEKDVSIIQSLREAIPAPGHYLLKRALIYQKTIGKFTLRGGRQEFIDTVTGQVTATRTNYYLGNDFARGVSCLDQNWSEGFRSFVIRTIGYSPGFLRSDSWSQTVPNQYTSSTLASRQATNGTEFSGPVLPKVYSYNYNERNFTIDGVKHYLAQTFNNEPLGMVGIQIFPRRVIVSYKVNNMSPTIMFQVRDRGTGQLLQHIYVKLPPSFYLKNGDYAQNKNWRISSGSIAIDNGKIGFDIIRNESSRWNEQYFRYHFKAPWETENSGIDNLPPHLDNKYYGLHSLPSSNLVGVLTAENLVGTWTSVPTKAHWEFKADKTLVLSDRIWEWEIKDGVLTARQRNWPWPNKDEASFRVSKNGKLIEVSTRNIAGEYEPFLLMKEN